MRLIGITKVRLLGKRLQGRPRPAKCKGAESVLMNTEIVEMTPQKAAELLLANTMNRPLNRRRVDQLAAEMLSGHWKENGDVIRISASGVLLDGQHRLSAIVKAGVTCQSILVTGLDTDVFHTIDTGDTRDAADILAISGHKSAAMRAAAIRLVDAYDSPGSDFRKRFINNREMIDLAAKYHDIDKSFPYSRQPDRLFPPSTAVACHYIFSRISPKDADAFMKYALEGVGLDDKSSILLLRRRLIGNLQSKAKLPYDYIIALTIKAWNSFRDGKPMGNLRYRETDGTQGVEKFPRAK